MDVRVTSAEISRNTSFTGSPLAGVIPEAARRGLRHMRDEQGFTASDVRTALAQVQERLKSDSWDYTCPYDRRQLSDLHQSLDDLSALADFVAKHAGAVRHLEDTRPRLVRTALADRSVEVAMRTAQQETRGRKAQRALGHMGHSTRGASTRALDAQGATTDDPVAATAMIAHELESHPVSSPVARMHRAANRALMVRDIADPIERATAKGDAYVRYLERGTKALVDLLRFVAKEAPQLDAEVRPRLAVTTSFAKKLPRHIAGWDAKDARWKTYAGADASLEAKTTDLIEAWAAAQEPLAIPNLIRLIRHQAPSLLGKPGLQKRLEEYVVSGLVFTAFEFALRGETASDKTSLPSMFTFTLPGWFGVQANLDPASDACAIELDKNWFAALFAELVQNATEATVRRRRAEGTYRDNADHAPLVHLAALPDKLRITVHDGGDPAAYLAHQHLGESGASMGGREGFGIGRLRIRLIAEYLGYGLAHRTAKDGSGSAIEVELPRRS